MYMQAIILAAGEGKRMRPLTNDRPKPLVVVAGKTLLEHAISALPPEIDELILVIGYRGDQIKEFCGSRFAGRPVRYVIQKEPRGTSDALRTALSFLKKDERFLVMFADDLLDPTSIRALLTRERSLLIAEHPEAERFGVVTVRPDGTLESIIEKPERPASNLISTGVAVLDHNIFKYEPERHPNGEFYLTVEINKMCKEYPVYAVKTNRWFPLATPEDIPKAEQFIEESKRLAE